MSDGGIVRRISELGISASLPELNPLPVFVGPSVGDEFNAVRSFLVPSACFRREDNSFDFDSSFLFDFDAGPLKELMDLHPRSKRSVFGHTDPSGQDDFNKVLSGRRAQSVLGLLLRDTSVWEDLYRRHDTLGNDKWGVRPVKIMLNRLKFLTGRADGVLDDVTKEHLTKFEIARGLAPSGFDAKQEIAKGTFKQLATEFMDAICADDDSNPFVLTRADFLARGTGRDGKGDIQGCGEFNPILLFARSEKTRLDQPVNLPERNEKNRPNRRVMILLFKAGSEVDPAKWPCPTVKEGVGGCKARFFVDGEQLRQNSAGEREFAKTKNTFACRFYARLVNSSPCERLLRDPLEVSVFVGSINDDLDTELLVALDSTGIVTRSFKPKDRTKTAGFRHFIIGPGLLPNPVELRWRTGEFDLHVAGPCDPIQLRDALAAVDLDSGHRLIGVDRRPDPPVTPKVVGVDLGKEDEQPFGPEADRTIVT